MVGWRDRYFIGTYKRQKLLNYRKRINYNRFKKFKSYNYKGYLQKIYKIRTKIYLKKKLVAVRMSLPEGIGN